MKTRTIVGSLLIVLAAANAAAAADVTCKINKSAFKVGESMTVTFSRPLPQEGEKYWITIIPATENDNQWGEWKYVDAGVTKVSVDGPKASGKFEVRLHDRYSEMPYHVICRMPVSITGESQPQGTITMTLLKSIINVGEKPSATFNMRLPKEGEKYWITVCPAGAPDSEWGQWQYVNSGVNHVQLKAATTKGNYEIRLHDRYAELPFHVIARQPLTVK